MTTRLTRTKAIQICKELWAWLAKTGEEGKIDWPGWERYGEMEANCPFCEYNLRQQKQKRGDICAHCPYNQKFGYKCVRGEKPFDRWDCADSADERKEAAKAFLAQLEQLE